MVEVSLFIKTEVDMMASFLKGKAQGRGRIVHANGDVYEGEWFQDHKQGYGVQ